MATFTHLRVASGYSFKYGTSHIEDIVERAREFGATALALTDRNGMAGAIRFAKSCEQAGIAPILGVNLSFLQKKHRVTLLAQSGKLGSLYRFLTAVNFSESDGVITHQLLRDFQIYTKDILFLHGPDSAVGAMIGARRYSQALSTIESLHEFVADQAIEVVSHQIKGDGPFSTPFAGRALGFARDHDLPAVISNAARMLNREDGPVADILDATRALLPLHRNHIERENSEAFLKSPEEMVALAEEIARSAGERTPAHLLRTTAQWAERATLSPRSDIGLGEIHLPESSVLGASNRAELVAQLRHRSEAGLRAKYRGELSIHAASRLEEELSTISTLGYDSYFLTVADITDMARQMGIRVAARGSGAGSLVCHLLGISGVEPLTHGLLMERFCSVLRAELPDIDIDVESARRLEIYDGVFERYGDPDWSKPGNNSRSATVAMVETYRARHAIRDVGAAMGLPPMEIDRIAKAMPHIRAKNIGRALENLPELKGLSLNTPTLHTLIQLAARLDGLPRHLAMHPCAIALSDLALHDRAPIMRSASGYPMLQFDKDDVEDIGLLKLDVLGVRMQSAITYALQEVERVEGAAIDIDAIDLEDPATFDLVKSARTLGIFQIESPGQRELVGKMAPNTFNDLIIDISLFRPGPVKSDMITPFLNFRSGLRGRAMIHSDLEAIMAETEGVVVFHEQVIRIIATLAGISFAESDARRRQLGTPEGQQEFIDWFYPTVLARGYPADVVNECWDILRSFASFGFCKAHAAAFALPTYQSAWLKRHHTAAFLAGVLTHDPGMYPKRVILDEARQWGISIEPIDINISDRSYRVEKVSAEISTTQRTPYRAPNTPSTGAPLELPDARGYAIRIGLADLRGINDREITNIIDGRPYIDLADFVYRSGASRPITESLVELGAFDRLHGSELNRRDLALHLGDLYRVAGKSPALLRSQMSLELVPETLAASGLPSHTDGERVQSEMQLLGMDVTHHLLHFYGEFLNAIGAVRSSDLIHHRAGASLLVAGVKVAFQTPPVRSGRRVIFLTLDDGHGCSDATFFEDIQNSHAELLYSSSLFLVKGELRRTGARGISIRATAAWDLPASYEKWRNLSNREPAHG